MRPALCCLAAIALCGHGAAAVELGTPGDLLSIEVHGFASQGWLLTTNNNYLAVSTDYGSFGFTKVGLNFNKSLTDKLRAGFQLFARRLGPTGNFDVRFDWFFLDYRAKDLKLEGHYLHGTAALNSALNDNQPLSALVEDFGLFLVKTTLCF